MNHQELMEFAKKKLGSPNYGLLGRLTKVYTKEFLANCIVRLINWPYYKKVSQKSRDQYLVGICRKNARAGDLINSISTESEKFKI